MNIAFAQVSWVSVVASSVAFSILGGLWFGAVMARPYAEALERPDILGQKPKPLAIAGPFVCSAVVSLANAFFMTAVGVTSLADAAGFGALVAAFYLLPMVVNIAINPNFPRPFLYSLINAPYFAVGNVVSCVIIEAMR